MIRVMARANLSLQGQLIPVYSVTTVVLDDEVKRCIAQFLLVPENEDGTFEDLGPIGPVPTPPGVRCCGG